MTRFRRLWKCQGCGAPLPSGELLDCSSCDAMYWAAKDQALARQIEKHDKFVAPELPTRRVKLIQIARRLQELDAPDERIVGRTGHPVVGNLAARRKTEQADPSDCAPVRVAALDPDIVEAVVARLDEITVPETDEGAKLIPITRDRMLWREEWPK